MGYVRSHFFSHHVLRIGDRAHLILAVIAGRGFYGEYDKSYTDQRICDMAANLLNELDAERYPFDLEATLQRARRRTCRPEERFSQESRSA